MAKIVKQDPIAVSSLRLGDLVVPINNAGEVSIVTARSYSYVRLFPLAAKDLPTDKAETHNEWWANTDVCLYTGEITLTNYEV